MPSAFRSDSNQTRSITLIRHGLDVARTSGTMGMSRCSAWQRLSAQLLLSWRSSIGTDELIGGFLRRPAPTTSFEKGLRSLVCRRALGQLILGLMPEFVFVPFGLSGLLPQFV